MAESFVTLSAGFSTADAERPDIAYTRGIPNMTVAAPKDENELQHLIFTALSSGKPFTVRYPRGAGLGVPLDARLDSLPIGRGEMLQLAGTPVTFPRQAALTHALYASDANRPVEVWAAEEQRLVNWLTKRLGFQVHAPDLNGVGFSLVGAAVNQQ